MPRENRFRTLFIAERASVLRFFGRTTGSHALAEDLAQEAFLRLAAADIGTLANPGAYLRRVSANLAIDEGRSSRRRRLTRAEVDDLLEVPDNAADPEARLIAKDTMDRVFAALAELPERRRQILLAARLDGEAHRTLAARYGVSTRTIEVEIQKALDHCVRAIID
ncbi:RNA polymerase sigma factor [Ancylobacter pratisalsi]|uniref:Sigma-70 family RNA polymerase sigma factor n=1 Tax=Ancylobacter pratisalsi TaxID=1745854 RepID=A0A6P1YP75_9HYPH|nr:sigma-70 family RNA polymerase sigma factor [Ancylobacter pratisalsi]QIB34710.1 sigma-70 family RNA polymerase sigma factor [Ancylobacter pratisalsi]